MRISHSLLSLERAALMALTLTLGATAACSSAKPTSDPPAADAPIAEEPVEAACNQGEQKPAEDGCNTCTCDEMGNWSCTELGCADADACTPGQTRAAEDGCNTCTCDEMNAWSCTELACEE